MDLHRCGGPTRHRVANIVLQGPKDAPARSADTCRFAPSENLRTPCFAFESTIWKGLINIRTQGDSSKVLEHENFILDGAEKDWFLAEVKFFQQQCLRRLDNMAKSTFTLIETGHCFVEPLFEPSFERGPNLHVLGRRWREQYSTQPGQCRCVQHGQWHEPIEARFPGEPDAPADALAEDGPIDAETAEDLGLVTAALDDIDWDDEVRIAIEERVSLSPDALTGMEQNLRFGGTETCETKIYGRLSAWQNGFFNARTLWETAAP